MEKDTHKTDVIFRKFKDGEILALFPHEIDNGRFVLSYMHLGQHSGADYKYCIKVTKPATENEYKSLLKELEGLGYNLNMVKRQDGWKYRQAYLNL